jgi:hypothetical protein
VARACSPTTRRWAARRLAGVSTGSLHDLALALRAGGAAGETMQVQVLREGKEAGQGVAYSDDGTMVVVDGGKRYLGQTLEVTVTSALQTSAGRMIFTKPRENGGADGRARRVAVLIPAGGIGTRLGRRTPKQFLRPGRRHDSRPDAAPLPSHPASAPSWWRHRPPHLARTRRTARGRPWRRGVAGGPRGRSRSGARYRPRRRRRGRDRPRCRAPFITRALVDAVVAAAAAGAAAICALPIAETVKRVRDGLVETTVDRAGLWAGADAAGLPDAAAARGAREGTPGRRDRHRRGDAGRAPGQPVRVVPGWPAT